MNTPYGFRLTNVAGQGFERWFNNPEAKLLTVNESGNIPDEIHRIQLAQSYMTYNKAYHYSKLRADALGFFFDEFTEKDLKQRNPVKQLFKRVFK